MGATSVMLLSGANTVGQFAAQRQQAGAVLASGAYQQRIADWNASMADRAAQDALTRGAVAETQQRQRTAGLIGSQRASLAAQGIDANADTGAEIQADTARMGELDALTIRNNAARESFGYQTQALSDRMQGEMAEMAGRNQASAYNAAAWGTLLTGAVDTRKAYLQTPWGQQGVPWRRPLAPARSTTDGPKYVTPNNI